MVVKFVNIVLKEEKLTWNFNKISIYYAFFLIKIKNLNEKKRVFFFCHLTCSVTEVLIEYLNIWSIGIPFRNIVLKYSMKAFREKKYISYNLHFHA